MSAASLRADDPRSAIARAARVRSAIIARPLGLALVVTALVTVLRLTGTVDSDVAWQLWIAHRIHAGAQLYRDIVEVNPPLWFWMALPIDRAATLFHLRAESVLIAVFGGLAALSLAATNRLIADLMPPRRAQLLGYAALTLAAMPWMHVGQREQIVLIVTLPYAAMMAARREGRPISPILAAAIGAGAAIGFALKHYFLVVPLLFELWLLAGQRRQWRSLRPETLAIAAIGFAYIAAILLWVPTFLTDTVPLVLLAYGVTGAPTFWHLLGPVALTGLVTLAFVGFHARRRAADPAPLTMAFAVAAFGFTVVYFLQSKGWLYHAIPLAGFASIALAALLAETANPSPLLRILSPALLSMPLLLAADEARHPLHPNPDLIAAVSGMHPNDTVGFLTVEAAIPWSIALQRDLHYPSRYISFWMLNAVLINEDLGNPEPRLAALGQQVVSETVGDFRCDSPRRIIVARPRQGEPGFDILAFFLRDPQFAQLMSHYRLRSRTSLETYDLVSPLPAPAPSSCRVGV